MSCCEDASYLKEVQVALNSYLTNYGQKANLWTFWTFYYGGKFRILGGNRGVSAVWTRILPRGMRNIERT
jgi:hypothetical protein